MDWVESVRTSVKIDSICQRESLWLCAMSCSGESETAQCAHSSHVSTPDTRLCCSLLVRAEPEPESDVWLITRLGWVQVRKVLSLFHNLKHYVKTLSFVTLLKFAAVKDSYYYDSMKSRKEQADIVKYWIRASKFFIRYKC